MRSFLNISVIIKKKVTLFSQKQMINIIHFRTNLRNYRTYLLHLNRIPKKLSLNKAKQSNVYKRKYMKKMLLMYLKIQRIL